MWTFELYRIMTAQRIAEYYREADSRRLVQQAAPAGQPQNAAPSDGDRGHDGPADLRAPIRHAG